MTHAPDRLAGLVASPGPATSPVVAASGGWPDAGDEDLVAGARLRTELALAAVARAADLPGERRGRPGAGPAGARVRWRIGPRAAVAAAVVLAALGGAAAWWWWPAGEPARVVSLGRPAAGDLASGDGGRPTEGAGAPGTGGRGDGSGDASGDGTGVVVVHVVGAVAAPGVVRLPAGSRVTDAVAAAGGALPDADLAGVNLARQLADGEQVVVPGAADAGGSPGAVARTWPGGAGSDVLDLNAADADALDALPGIGPVLAQRIVAWRTSHGRFTSVDELAEVTGIGPTLLAGIRDLVRV